MKKYVMLIALLAGCQRQEPPPVQVVPQLVSPPVIADPLPPAVTASFLQGYHDGYYGKWVRPGAWVVMGEYRHGWGAGSFDRSHNLPNKYEHSK